MAEAHLRDQKRLQTLAASVQKASLVSIQRYRQGAIGIVEVSDALNLWSQNLLNERSAYYNYLLDLAKWERLMGRETVHYEN